MSVATFISRQSPKFRRGLATNSTDPSFQASGGPVPQAAVPATIDSSSPYNSIVQDLTGEFTQLAFFGTDANNEGATVKVVFWTEVQQRTDDTSALWVPYDQGTYEVFFSSTQNGIASSPVLSTEYVADTLTEKDTTWDDNMIEMIKNPGGDRMATVTLKNMGYQKIGVYFDKDSPTGGARQYTLANEEFHSLDPSINPGTSDFAISGWFYLDDTTTNKQLISCGGGGGGHNGFAIYTRDDQMRLYFVDSVQTGRLSTAKTAGITADAWFGWVWNFDRDGNGQLWVNNVDKGTVDISSHAASLDPDGDLAIGGLYGTAVEEMNGRIALTGWWNRLLTTAEISQLYNGGLGLTYGALDSGLRTSLVSYWNLNEESGNAIDQHGSNDLIDNNTVTSAQGPGADSSNVNALIKCF